MKELKDKLKTETAELRQLKEDHTKLKQQCKSQQELIESLQTEIT